MALSYTTFSYSTREMQAIMLARQVENGQTVIIGTGLPLIGATLAKNTYAPNCHLVVETGIIDSFPKEVPTSVSDLRFMDGASVLWEQFRYFGLQNNSIKFNTIDLGFIGGAQIDPYGNINSTVIGDYYKPKTRFTGSGGANGIATFVNTVIIMQHEKRRFVEKVDYLTSPGWIDGPNGRAKMGLPPDKGPLAVVTELGLMRFDENTKRMYLAEYYPGVNITEIVERTGFEIDVSRAVQAKEPEPDVLNILREKVDPTGIFIRK